jgi:hypothetical protein
MSYKVGGGKIKVIMFYSILYYSILFIDHASLVFALFVIVLHLYWWFFLLRIKFFKEPLHRVYFWAGRGVPGGIQTQAFHRNILTMLSTPQLGQALLLEKN